MLTLIVAVPVIAAALIGLLKTPGKPTAIIAAAVMLILSACAIFGCNACCGSSCTEAPALCNLSLDLPLSKIMLALTVLVTFGAALGLKAPNPAADRSWAISTLLISAGAAGAFMSDNLISFYGFHELALIPTFVMIGYYGRGDRRTIAWTTTIYLGLASMVLLAGILILGFSLNTWSFSDIAALVDGFTAAGCAPVMEEGGATTAAIAGLLLLIGFGTLVSLFPFHSWAAPAYASAPTPVAMMHAGVLKKFGLYGLFTLAWAMGPLVGYYFGDWVNLLLVLLLGNILWVGYVTVSRTRLDDMLGNSSVMHMGYLFLALAVFINSGAQSELAFKGAALLMLAHGLTIAMLFLLTGQIESQTRTLELDSMGGLAQKLPKLGFFFGLAGLASIGLPLLANFPGEFTIFMSCFDGWQPGTGAVEGGVLGSIASWFGGLGPVQLTLIFALWGLVISAIYMLRAFRRIFTGDVRLASERATRLSACDILSAAFLAFFIVLFGVYPGVFF